MSRLAASDPFRVSLPIGAIVGCALLWLVVPIAFAEAATGALDASRPWLTPEARAFEAARFDTGKAYIDCLLTTLRDDAALSAGAARSQCTAEGDQYAKYLPVDTVDVILDRVAGQVKAAQ